MKKLTLPFLILFLLCTPFIASFMGGIGLDISADRIFTLSKVSKNIAKNADENTVLHFYFSQNAASENPELKNYGFRVRDILRQYARASNGKIRLNEINVRQFSQEEDMAISYGLIPFSEDQASLEPIYIGLVAINGDKAKTIKIFDPINEPRLEYEISNILQALNDKAKKNIALITGLDWFINQENGAPIAKIAAQLNQDYNLNIMKRDFSEFAQKPDALIIAQPWALSNEQIYAIEQYILNGGHTIFALDALSTIGNDNELGIKSYGHELGALQNSLGLIFANEIIMDKENAIKAQSLINGRNIITPQPLYYSLLPNGAQNGVNFATASYFNAPNNGLKFTPLIESSIDTMRININEAQNNNNPQSLLLDWQSDNQKRVIVANIEGKAQSIFNNGGKNFVKAGNINIIAFADCDFLADSLYINEGAEIGDNGLYFLGTIAQMTGGQNLGLLGSKIKNKRQLDRIIALKTNAQNAIIERESVIDNKITALNTQLSELQNNGQANEAQIKQMRAEILKTRAEARQIKDGVRRAIDGIRILIIFICGFAIPAIFVLFAIYRNYKIIKMGDN